MAKDDVEVNGVGWSMLEGYPWWPAYVCDPHTLREELYSLGNKHRMILRKARKFEDSALIRKKKKMLKPWDCSEADKFLNCHPKTKNKGIADLFANAVEEAEEFLAEPEDTRLPPHMVPSDLDPQLEPPPPPPPTEEEENEENEENEQENDENEEVTKMEDGDPLNASEAESKKNKKASNPPKKRKSTSETNSSAKKSKTKASAKKKTAKKESKRDGEDDNELDTEKLALRMKKELRVLFGSNELGKFTTRIVRKYLEEKLEMDLHAQKKQIKLCVNDVIAEMDENDSKMDSEKIEHGAEVENVEVNETPEVLIERNNDAQTTESKIQAIQCQLIKHMDLSPKEILVLFDELDKLDVKPEHLLNTDIFRTVGGLRSHSDDSISKAASELRSKWKAENSSTVKDNAVEIKVEEQAIKEEEINEPSENDVLEIKKKIEQTQDDHDQLYCYLETLQKMNLGVDHMIKTGIGKVVADLRQHKNDKVSAKAKDLRNVWKNLAKTNQSQQQGQSSPATTEGKTKNSCEDTIKDESIKEENSNNNKSDEEQMTMKKLEEMRLILEEESIEEHVQKRQIKAIGRLYKMKITTTQVIGSNIGITISKLRKSSIPKIASAAGTLRTKWKKELL